MTHRPARLAATTLAAGGLAGCLAAPAMSGVDGTLAFPLALAVGIWGLNHYRPRRAGRHPMDDGPTPERGSQQD